MDDNFRELEREAFEATFDGKAEDAGKPEGYGLDPRQAEMEAMASTFNGAEAAATDGQAPLNMPDEAQSSQAPAEMELAAADTVQATEQPAADAAAAPEFKTFGQAFKWHRAQAANGGLSTFEWNGKKFTTQLKSEVAPGKAKPVKSKAAAEAAKFESEFINRDKPPAKPIDRSKTLAVKEAAASQPLNLDVDPAAMKSIDEIAAGVARASANKPAKPAPATPPAKELYYRGKGIKQGEMS